MMTTSIAYSIYKQFYSDIFQKLNGRLTWLIFIQVILCFD